MLKKIFNKLLRHIELHLAFNRLRIWKTIYVNFRTLPFHIAWKLPIYIYGPTRLYSLAGNIEIKGPIRRGMIMLGRDLGLFSAQHKSSMLFLDYNTKIVFSGPCRFDIGYAIRLTNNAIAEFGKYTRFGSGTQIIGDHHIKIGDYTGVAYNSCFMDSNLHFTVNIESGMVKNKAGEVIVGKYNWIACGSIIRKGTVTKEYTIVASRSLLNKDYTKQEGEFQTLAGSPAKIIGTSHKRIFSRAIEASLIQYFKTENHSEKHLTPEELQNASFL